MRLHARLLVVTLMSLVMATGALVMTSPAHTATWQPELADSFDPSKDFEEFEDRILVQVNKARARKDLPKVRVFESCIDGYAERWAGRLSRTEELQHRNLNKVIDGCNLAWVGEALVAGTGLTPSGAVKAWLDSPPHREILLKPRARQAGVGVRISDDGRVYGVLNFGDRT